MLTTNPNRDRYIHFDKNKETIDEFINGLLNKKEQTKTQDRTETKIKEWPKWARIIKRYRTKEDKGVGDTIERLLGEGGTFITKFFEKYNINCGCKDRKLKYNTLYSYQL